jgi:uroporphyrin-III C-methyltransferase
MGMSKLDQIVALFQKSRKAKCLAIIQNGTTAAEKVGIGTVNTIQSVVAAKV